MCQFFSLVSNGRGRIFYFNHIQRQEIESTDLEPDSHSSIVDYYRKNGQVADRNTTEDLFNKWEYNPLTKELTCDTMNTKDDTESIQKFCDGLDFKTIVPELIIKPIVHPFKIKAGKVGKREIDLLKEWDSVGYSVRDSVGDSVGDSVRYSVWDSVWDSVRDSVGYSVRDSVRDSVWDSVGYSVWDSVGYSVWDSVGYSVGDSVGAYISSFFQLDQWKGIEHEKGVNPFQSGIDLWEAGFVPSFDGDLYRLHSGKDAKVVYEISKEKLMEK